LSASPITERGEKATASSSSLRDSIFEKSRMSLRIDSSRVGDVRTVARPSRWSGVSSLSRDELGHTDDPVHRRADLVAHVREKLALGRGWLPSPCRARASAPRWSDRKLGGARVDGVLQIVLLPHAAAACRGARSRSAYSLNRSISLPDLVVVAGLRAGVILVVAGHDAAVTSVRTQEGRRRDHPLEPVRPGRNDRTTPGAEHHGDAPHALGNPGAQLPR